MRRRWAALVVAAVLLGVLVNASPGVAAPAQPHVPAGGTVTGPTLQVYAPFNDPAGDPCPFAIHGAFPVSHVVSYTYSDASGKILAAYYTGPLTMRITRADTGRSVTVNIGGDGIQTFAADGSSIVYGFGPFSSTQHPGDHPGRELAVLHGISALAIAADGTKTILYSTRVTDVCTRLAENAPPGS